MNNSVNLDVLRSTAVLLVVGDHSLKMIFGIQTIAGVDINKIGLLGVLFFFVHTCLVLMYSLQRQDRGGGVRLAAHFYIRRAFRIYPLSIFVLTAIMLFHIPSSHVAGIGIVADYGPCVSEIIANMLLIQNVFFGNHILGVLWSLPWEVQMYFALPVLYITLARNRNWSVLLGLWVFFALGGNHIPLAHYVPAFLPGVIAYALAGKRKYLPAFAWPVFLAVLIAAFCVAPEERWGFVICLILGCGIPFFRDISFQPLATVAHQIANHSYGIYLGHLFCLWLCFSRIPDIILPIRLAAYPFVLAAVTYCLYRFIELPFISLGSKVANRLLYLPQTQMVAATHDSLVHLPTEIQL